MTRKRKSTLLFFSTGVTFLRSAEIQDHIFNKDDLEKARAIQAGVATTTRPRTLYFGEALGSLHRRGSVRVADGDFFLGCAIHGPCS